MLYNKIASFVNLWRICVAQKRISCKIWYSSLVLQIVEKCYYLGLLRGFEVHKPFIILEQPQSVLFKLKSKPGKRCYVSSRQVQQSLNSREIWFLHTSTNGLCTNFELSLKGCITGGELIFSIVIL